MLYAGLHFWLEDWILLNHLFHLHRRLILIVVRREMIYCTQILILLIRLTWPVIASCICSPLAQTIRPEGLGNSLITRVIAALTLGLHSGSIGLVRHSRAHHLHLVLLSIIKWGEIFLISLHATRILQSDSRIVSRGHHLWLHVKEVDHSIKGKVFFWSIFHLLSTAVKNSLERSHLCAVQIQCLAETFEVVFAYWKVYLVLLYSLIDLIFHMF